MCGICGILGESSPNDIEAMVAALNHRGPDDSGAYHESGIALAMARLAIIDVSSAGHQPMANSDGSVWIVYNGETYNYRSERELLVRKGYSFVSNSDTEVVLRMYEHYGDDFLLRLRGMFALAVYDKRKGIGEERLLLARDQLGVKPLLYSSSGSRLVFASEMKAILKSRLVDRELDPESLRLLLTFGSVPQPLTMVKGVKMLLPGHRLIRENGSEHVERYWSLQTDRIAGLREKPYHELIDHVRSSLEESVCLQMVSDVPLGAFLSGGVDSALLVSLMARNSRHRVKTFSVGFESEGAHIDETDDAERVARHIGTDHTRVVVTGKDVFERVNHIAAALDQPSVDGVNSYFVSLAARQGVTVALSGTGGDESFAGYPWFIQMVVSCARDKKHPLYAAANKLLAAVARNPVFDPLLGSMFGKFIEKARSLSGFVSRYARIYQIFGAVGTSRVISSDFRALVRAGRELASDIVNTDELPESSPLERVSALCLRGYTQNQLLRDIDSVSMSHSLEVRVPYLDTEVVDMAFSLPLHAKLGDVLKVPDAAAATYKETGTKRILVDIGRELLPEGMDLQVKRGFGMPFDAWLKGALRDVVEDTLSKGTTSRRGYFDPVAVQDIRKDFYEGRIGWPKPWLLLMTELWCREVLDQ